jgi:hypothetical protein
VNIVVTATAVLIGFGSTGPEIDVTIGATLFTVTLVDADDDSDPSDTVTLTV